MILYRENHTFDDYLGDCATTIQAGCNGVVQSTNHISSVPNLHTLAKTYALMDAYSTGTQPPSGPNHWWLFSAQSSSSSQQQSYPAATGTQFDRFLKGPSGGYPFVMNGDFYWMLNSGSGYWRNPATAMPRGAAGEPPRHQHPGGAQLQPLHLQRPERPRPDHRHDYLNFVAANGLPAYSYVELFNDHPGTFQDIPTNDAVTKQIVDSIMNNASYKDNTMIVVTEDDTQNGNNGPDHVSNTYRVPTGDRGIADLHEAALRQPRRVHGRTTCWPPWSASMQNVHPGIIDPNNNIGLATFPMTTADQAGLGDPLEDLWIQGATPLSATATGTPTTGNAPLGVSFTGSATGGNSPLLLQLELRRRVGGEHPPEPEPHLQLGVHLHCAAHRDGQLGTGEDGHVERHHHRQRGRQPAGRHRLGHADLGPGPVERRLQRHRHRRHPALRLQLEFR